MPHKNFTTCGTGTAEYVCGDASWSYDQIWRPKVPPDADPSRYPYGGENQSDIWSSANGKLGCATCEGGRLFNASQLPIKDTLAHEFGVFNRYFSSVPSASTPNHMFAQSATSCGIHDNLMYSSCGGSTDTFPQLTIFDSLHLHNRSFAFFLNSTCGLDGDPCHSVDPHTPNAGSPLKGGAMPDVAMDGVGRYKRHFASQEDFYRQAASGSLPALSWFLPPAEASDHPCYALPRLRVFALGPGSLPRAQSLDRPACSVISARRPPQTEERRCLRGGGRAGATTWRRASASSRTSTRPFARALAGTARGRVLALRADIRLNGLNNSYGCMCL